MTLFIRAPQSAFDVLTTDNRADKVQNKYNFSWRL